MDFTGNSSSYEENYIKSQKSAAGKDKYHIKKAKRLVQTKIKSAYNNNLADILGVVSRGGKDA